MLSVHVCISVVCSETFIFIAANPPGCPWSWPRLSLYDKDKIVGFHTLHDSHATQFRDAWVPHTQTQRYGVLAIG